jgi:hypothetical protein
MPADPDRILRVPYEKLVSLCLRAECTSRHVDGIYAQEERSARLVLTMADGGCVEVPLSYTQISTSDGLAPLDRAELRTPDEYSADRILTWLEKKSTSRPQLTDVVELLPAPSYALPHTLAR